MVRSLRFFTALALVGLSASLADAQMSYGPPPLMGSYNGMAPPGMTYGNNVVNYRVNRHGSRWNEQQPVEAFLSQFTRRSWMRLEFMHWSIEDPGNQTIGAPISDIDGRTPFDVEDRASGDEFGFSIVPDLNNLSLNDNAAIRGTYGIWFDGGAIEFSVMGNDQSADLINFSNLQANRPEDPDPDDPNPPAPNAGLGTELNPNVIIPLNVDGIVGDSGSLGFLGFDSSYRASIQSQFWGTELNVLTKPQASVNAITWQWLGGLRYLNFDESFNQVGVSDGGGAFAPITSRIRASTTNNMYGPTIGFRTSLDSKYLTLSATPRITFALNDYTSRLSTSGNGFDTPTSAAEEEIDFTTLTQVSFTAEIHPTEALTFFGGYDLFWSYRTARPFRGIDYDSTIAGDNLIPQLGLNADPESLYFSGFSFGLTYRF